MNVQFPCETCSRPSSQRLLDRAALISLKSLRCKIERGLLIISDVVLLEQVRLNRYDLVEGAQDGHSILLREVLLLDGEDGGDDDVLHPAQEESAYGEEGGQRGARRFRVAEDQQAIRSCSERERSARVRETRWDLQTHNMQRSLVFPMLEPRSTSVHPAKRIGTSRISAELLEGRRGKRLTSRPCPYTPRSQDLHSRRQTPVYDEQIKRRVSLFDLSRPLRASRRAQKIALACPPPDLQLDSPCAGRC